MHNKSINTEDTQQRQQRAAQQTRITEIEEFINEVLKEELRQLEHYIGQYNEEIMEYVQLKNTLQTFEANLPEGYKTQVNIGSNVFMQARVRQFDRILVNVGKDIYMEMSLLEAKNFSDVRINILTKQSAVLREESIKKRAEIKMAVIAISEISQLILQDEDTK